MGKFLWRNKRSDYATSRREKSFLVLGFQFSDKPLMVSQAILLALLLPVLLPNTAVFIHWDFLDSFVPLVSLWSSQPLGHFSGDLPFVFGGDVVPRQALGFSEISPVLILYRFLSLGVAVSLSEVLGRLVIFYSLYFFLRHLKKNAGWVNAISALFLATMPFHPIMTWSIVAITATLWAYSTVPESTFQKILLAAVVLLTPSVQPFAWGGFFPLLVGICWGAYAALRDNQQLRRVLFLASGTLLGTLFSTLGLILLFASEFQSHRDSFVTPRSNDPNARLLAALAKLREVAFGGTEHYTTGIYLFHPASMLAISAIVLSLVVFFSHRLKPFGQVSRGSRRLSSNLFGLLGLVAIHLAVSTAYSFEVSGVTDLAGFVGVPFQFNRVVGYLPVSWALIFALSLRLLAESIPNRVQSSLLSVLVAAVLIPTIASGGTIAANMQSLIFKAPPEGFYNVRHYFDVPLYREISASPDPTIREAKLLHLGGFPMKAVVARVPALDGYVWNYPASYKEKFFAIVKDDLVPGDTLEFFVNWGSLAMIFDRFVPAQEMKIDWCAAKALGATHLVARRNLGPSENLELVLSSEGLDLHEIQATCDPASSSEN